MAAGDLAVPNQSQLTVSSGRLMNVQLIRTRSSSAPLLRHSGGCSR